MCTLGHTTTHMDVYVAAALAKLEFLIGNTYSVDSTVGVVGIIINMQFTRMVVMINNENNGCTKM